MAKAKKARDEPGDYRIELDALGGEEQPLSAEGKALVRRAYTLFEYFSGKLRESHDAMREARKLRQLKQDEKSRFSPLSMTLNSCVDNVIADQIDNMPEAVMIPEREETATSAEEMTDVVSYVLEQAGWPGKYQQIMEDAAVTGTGIAQVFWDEDMENGEGMVNVLAWHPEDFYPDPSYEDIQDGRGCFKTTATSVAWVEEHYPEAKGFVKPDRIRESEPINMTIDMPDGDQRVTLLEFWYKRYDAKKRRYHVHMAQFAGQALLYSTELGYGTGGETFKTGVYAHGRYPFELYRYRKVFRWPFGTGLMHDYEGQQHAIDRYAMYIDDNARKSSAPRYFIRRGTGITADVIADMNNEIIEWEGTDIREVMQVVQADPLNGQVYQMMNYLADTMKQDSGQNQFSRGEGGLGVTAASAINQLVTQGGKITRWHAEQFKDAFREMVEQILWVLSDYMTPQRKLRIVGGWNSDMSMKDRLVELKAPGASGDRLPKPAYTVRVGVQKHDPLWWERHNQMVQTAAQVAATAGTPIPPYVQFAMMKGVSNQGQIVNTLKEVDAMHVQMKQMAAQLQEMQQRLEAKDAVIRSDAQAMGSPSIARQMKQPGGNPEYSPLMQLNNQAATSGARQGG